MTLTASHAMTTRASAGIGKIGTRSSMRVIIGIKDHCALLQPVPGSRWWHHVVALHKTEVGCALDKKPVYLFDVGSRQGLCTAGIDSESC